jgi:iron complex outermembrane receptor protein
MGNVTNCDNKGVNTMSRIIQFNSGSKIFSLKARFYAQFFVAVLLAVTTNANAQISSEEKRPSANVLEEILVTSQRRTESLYSVPISVSAFGKDELTKRGITKQNELQGLVPGVTMITTNSSNEFDYAIRGQTLQQYSGSAPAVLTYLNEAPMSPHSTSGSALYDVDGIEVLKGPQGTLFGRNNTGGAVLIKTTMPGDESEGYFRLSGGDYNMVGAEGAVTIPFSSSFSLRIAANIQREDGYITNVLEDTSYVIGGTTLFSENTTLGDVDNKSIRLSAKWTPNDAVTSTFVFQHDKAGGTTGVPQIFSHYTAGQTHNGNNLTTLTDSFTGGQQSVYADLAKQNPYEEYLLYTGPHKSDGMYFLNTTTYDLSDNIQLKNVLSYNESDSIVSNQLNASPFIILADLDPSKCCDGLNYLQENWSEEFQIIGQTDDSKWKYIVGAFVSSNDTTNIWPFTFGGFSFYWRYKTEALSKAIYSQATYDLSDATGIDGLSTTVGLRYTWEELEAEQLPGGINYFEGNVLSQNKTESEPSWHLGLEYQKTDAMLLYATTRGSWRAGGYNNGTAGANGQGNQFDKETTQDIEIGAKYDGTLADRPFRGSAAIFSQWNQDYQATLYILSGGAPSAAPVNIDSARTWGIELSVDASVTSSLRMGGAAAYNDAEFTDPKVSSGAGLTGDVDNFANTPEFSASLFASVDLPTPLAWGDMSIRADGYHVSKRPFSNFTETIIPDSTLPGYTTINMRFDWENVMESGVSIAIYGKNITDEMYWLGGFPLGFIQGTNTAIPARPRTYGAEMSYNF